MPIRAPLAEPIHRSTANVSVARAAAARRRRARSHCRARWGRAPRRSRRRAVSVSPGSTTRLNRQSSMPAKNAICPRFCSSASTATAPVWAIASTISTPGITGRSGKCPGTHHVVGANAASDARRAPRVRARSPRRAAGTGRDAGGSARSVSPEGRGRNQRCPLRCSHAPGVGGASEAWTATPTPARIGATEEDAWRRSSPARGLGHCWKGHEASLHGQVALSGAGGRCRRRRGRRRRASARAIRDRTGPDASTRSRRRAPFTRTVSVAGSETPSRRRH